MLIRRRKFTIGNIFRALGSYLLSLGLRVFRAVKEFTFYILSVLQHNPLVPKITGISCLSLFIFGALFLVSFAIISPELPPGNMVSTLNNMSVYYHTPGTRSQILTLSSEEDWALKTVYTEYETGSGLEAPDRSINIDYPIRPGETLSEIAYAYDVSYDFLAWFNNINNPHKVQMGTVITIPSLDNIKLVEPQYQQIRARQTQAAEAARAVRSIEISYEGHNNGALIGPGITVQFSIINPPPDLRSYEWDLGDGRRSFRENPSYEYSDPKTYVVRLTAQDDAGIIYRSSPLYIDIPHPTSAPEFSTTKFVTLSAPDEYWVIRGEITKVARYASIESSPLDLSESDQFLTKVRFQKSGYFGITVREESGKEQYYSIFVSPIPTAHVDYKDNNFNWYRTQYNTGTTSNCGPASVSMAIGWGAKRNFPVSSVRQAVGWQGDGGTSFEELLRVIRSQGIAASIQPLRSVQDIRNIIDSGAIAIILFQTDGVRTTRVDPAVDLFGKYYHDTVGHYSVIKGYSLNGEYFVVHDPIPSDFVTNSFRYGDEISMIGQNRYYSAPELLRALRRWDMIVVPGQ